MYNKIRNAIANNEHVFTILSKLYTPIRVTKEHFQRRNLAIRLISTYQNIKREDPKIVYFGIPQHNNLGDIAQTYCIRKWLRENYKNNVIIEVPARESFDKKIHEFLRTRISDSDLFIFQSGYCTSEGHLDHRMHLNIVEKFPNQPCVILPQTVNLVKSKSFQEAKEVFGKHNKLLFIARDKTSFLSAKQFVNDKQLKLYPDMVTSLIGRDFITCCENRNGVLVCVRNDKEKFYSELELNNMIKKIESFATRVNLTDTNSPFGVKETYDHLEEILKEKIRDFSTYEVVVTDRYHGTIFSIIANTPVVVIRSNDHKVTSGVDWFKGLYDEKAVQLANDLEEAFGLVKNICSQKSVINNNDSLYKAYYDHSLLSDITALR